MSQSRVEWRVGLFVFIGLILLAALLINFSKGMSLFKPTYEIQVKTSTMGGLQSQAKVLMSGVQIGNVKEISLAEGGKAVLITLSINEKYKIHSDARFAIDSMGLLGDQYVAVRPQENKGHVLQPGEVVTGEEPFDFQEIARASLGFIHRIDKTAEHLNAALRRVDRLVLNEETLTNLSAAVSNFRRVSERALTTVDQMDKLFQTNTSPISTSVSNLVEFSRQLNEFAEKLDQTLAMNEPAISNTLKNFEVTSETARDLADDIRAGKGLVGGLLQDAEIKMDVSVVLSNLTVLTSNLNRYGLLYKPKKPRIQPDNPFPYPGKRPQ